MRRGVADLRRRFNHPIIKIQIFTEKLMKNKMLKLALSSSLMIACTVTVSFGHTSIEKGQIDPKTMQSNNVVIAHGCTDGGKKIPVVAQSVLFPTVNPILFRSTDPENPATDLTLSDILRSGTLANIPQMIQSKEIFKAQREKKDAAGNVIGFESFNGKLSPDFHGFVPFATYPVAFKPESCALRLVVKIAVADICKMSFPPRKGTANLWIPRITSKFTEILDGTNTTKVVGSPASLIFERPATMPIDSITCGEGYDVLVFPSDEDVDANLPIKKRWS